MDWFTREHHCICVDRSNYCQVQMSFSLLEALTKTNQNKQNPNRQKQPKKKTTRKEKGCFTSVVGSRAAETDFRAISGVSLLHKCRGHLIQTVHGPFMETRNDTPAPFSFLFFLLHVFALFYVGRGLKTTSWQKAELCSYCKA